MQTSLPSKEVTTRQVSSVTFSFYTDEQVRKLSVKRIVSPITFGNLKDAVPGGLYDPAMGPLDVMDRCGTCHLTHAQCPGHFGHIELSLPVYNPLTFRTLYRLLRTVCLHCFKFRMSTEEVQKFQLKMELLSRGRVTEAAAVHIAGKSKEHVLDELGVDKEEGITSLEALSSGRLGGDGAVTSIALASLQETEGAFFKRFGKNSCPNCGAKNPGIVKQGYQKLFKVWKSRKPIQQNQENGIVIRSVLDAGVQPQELEQEMAAKLEAAAAKRSKRKGQAEPVAEGTNQADDSDVDEPVDVDTEDEDEDMKDDVKDDMDVDGAIVKKKDDKEETVTVTVGGIPASRPAPQRPSQGDLQPLYMSPLEVEEIMKRLWANESGLLQYLYADDLKVGSSSHGIPSKLPKHNGYKMFFLRTIAVAPNKFRPPAVRGEDKYEHEQNVALGVILNAVLDLQNISPQLANKDAPARQLQLNYYTQAWLRLQNGVCTLMDSTTSNDKNPAAMGIRQQLEKKEGLFRKNMMGKRVNFAARSVISPDPYIGTGEIGVPPYFAKRLSYPERVTVWNVELLRKLVVNGADTYPGALAVEDEHGVLKQLKMLPKQNREAIAKQLLSSSSWGRGSKPGKQITGTAQGSKIVYRHLRDGDIMLTNRQPTLHKPGLMAHRARVLKGERTIRMHYANCQTFNADFDGDELNLHFPQDHLARAEGYYIVHADEQYIVPTDGKPIRGLIQDHIIAGTLLMKRDSFFTRAEYMQMLYVACSSSKPAAAAFEGSIALEPPTVLRPRVLWSGKQVLSTVLSHFTRGLLPITHSAPGKVPRDYWGKNSEEGELNIHKGYVLTGVMDKNQYGKYGLVHAMQELYGNQVAGAILSAFSRLFTFFHQWHGFTCGINDVLLVQAAEQRRQELVATAEARAVQASADFAGVEVGNVQSLDPDDFATKEKKVAEQLSEKFRSNKDTGVGLDMKVSGAMHPLSSEVVKACLPSGQVKPFPKNCMALMTVSGAKGSLVNFSQISCLLGQQELEGRRVPRMASGKTLPCFEPYDPGARAGGFVGDRFLSGLRPQEYYFHCMAGREGLVDTTVKTSRSGYLQRCLVKNLESLRVHYDYTVRDSCDGSIVQFMYGEDGVDVTNTSYLQQYSFLAKNAARFSQKAGLKAAMASLKSEEVQDVRKEVAKHNKRRQKLLVKAQKKPKYSKDLAATLPVTALHPLSTLGCVSERFADGLADYVSRNPDGLLKPSQEEVDTDGQVPGSPRSKKKMQSKQGKSEVDREAGIVDAEGFVELMQLKFMRSLAAPGEAVGVIAGQSVGEPSTQMTLNTFHMAGRGEANVTLGIPRLREILMAASGTIKTPVMTLPMKPGLPLTAAHTVAGRLRRLRFAECLSGITVEEQPVAPAAPGSRQYVRRYRISLHFFHPERFPAELKLQWEHVAACFDQVFTPKLKARLRKEMKAIDKHQIDKVELSQLGRDPEVAGTEGAAVEGEDQEGGSQRQREKTEKDDGYEDEEEDQDMVEGKLRFRGEKAVGGSREDDEREDEEDEREARPTVEVDEEEEEVEDEQEGEEAEIGDAGPDSNSAPTRSKPGASQPASKPQPAKRAGSKKQQAANFGLESKHDLANCTCSLEVSMPITARKVLMLDVVEAVAAASMLRHTPGIDKCYVVPAERGGEMRVQTDGINFEGAWQNEDLVDVNRVTTNHVKAMLDTYGVEAARATIMHEVQAVFKAYGIGVDPRHLSLIADFMTHEGGYRGCNRSGIESNTSPFLKMSFETATRFLMDATLKGAADDLKSPASQICIGRVVELGTGAVELIQQI